MGPLARPSEPALLLGPLPLPSSRPKALRRRPEKQRAKSRACYAKNRERVIARVKTSQRRATSDEPVVEAPDVLSDDAGGSG